MDATQKRELAKQTTWFHSIDLSDGVVTEGRKPHDVLQQEAREVFKHGVEGRSVLDVGAWNGFFSFEAKRRGAARVMATDWYCWSGPGWGTKDGFDIARQCTGLDVESHEVDIPDISPERLGTWDVVLFLGVFYHLKNPLDGLERVARVAKEQLVVETHVDKRLPAAPPAMVFYPFDDLSSDPSNWWGPNPACVTAMLQVCGFKRVEHTEGAYSRATFHAFR